MNATKHSANTDELTTERQETQEANEGLVNLISTIKREGMWKVKVCVHRSII